MQIKPSTIARLKESSSLLVLTGAGVSSESGIPTFRGVDGLWRKYRPEELATPEAFERNPKLVWEWYEYRRNLIRQAAPNPAHIAITKLENFFKDFLLVTQNVDGLHFKAGNRKVVELHGNIFRSKCSKDGRVFEEIPESNFPPKCECGAYLRPDVVWFGESLPPHAVKLAFDFAMECETMLVVGTSGVVQPAASLPSIVKRHRGWVLEINVEPTPITHLADESIFGRAGEVLPKIVEMIGQ